MIRGMQTLSEESVKTGSDILRIQEKCPVCNPVSGRGVLCCEHEGLIHDFGELKEYINGLERYDNNTLYILDCAIGNRVSYVISAHEKESGKRLKFIKGKLAIEEFLEEKIDKRMEEGKEVKCSLWMERILREILVLRKAKSMIVGIMKEKKE